MPIFVLVYVTPPTASLTNSISTPQGCQFVENTDYCSYDSHQMNRVRDRRFCPT